MLDSGNPDPTLAWTIPSSDGGFLPVRSWNSAILNFHDGSGRLDFPLPCNDQHVFSQMGAGEIDRLLGDETASAVRVKVYPFASPGSLVDDYEFTINVSYSE